MSKVRSGFVSNSSSSSFVLIGIKLDRELAEDEYENLDEKGLRYASDGEVNGSFLGKMYIIHDDDWDVSERIIPDIDKLLVDIQEYFPDTKKEDIKMYIGTRAS